jgi:FkbM family methyltransferase
MNVYIKQQEAGRAIMAFVTKLCICLKICARILRLWLDREDPEHRNFLLLRNKLILRHEIGSLCGPSHQKASVLGYCVYFQNFDELIRLIDEIFGKKIYSFQSSKKSPLIIDCGANIGMSILAFKKSCPEARILAFEPDPNTCAILRKNIAGNALPDVEVVEAAVADARGDIRFYKTVEGKHSLLSSTSPANIPGAKEIRVRAERLADYITGEVDLLKMDVEGSEMKILEDLAAQKKLGWIREILLEYHHHLDPRKDELASFFRLLEADGFGYQVAASRLAPPAPGTFQDILIRAYRNSN